jgi:hypothetical protein
MCDPCSNFSITASGRSPADDMRPAYRQIRHGLLL